VTVHVREATITSYVVEVSRSVVGKNKQI
jgi:hypothetical protein